MKIPQSISDPTRSTNQAIIVGRLTQSKQNNVLVPFFREEVKKHQVEGEPIQTYYIYQGDIIAKGSSVRVKALNTTKNPTLASDLNDMFQEGDWVYAEGSLSESYNEEKKRTFREVLLRKMEIVSKEDEEAKIAVILQGTIGHFSIEDKEIHLLIQMPKFNSDQTNEFRITGFKDNEFVQWLIAQKPKNGDVIKVACRLKNEVIRDKEFGDIVEIKNYLELGKITNYAVTDTIW